MRQIRRSDTIIPVLCAAAIIGWLGYNKAGPTEYSPDALQEFNILGIPTEIPYGFLSDFERAKNGPPGLLVRVRDHYNHQIHMAMVYPEMRYKIAADSVRDENRDLPKENMRVYLQTMPGIKTTYPADMMEEEYAGGFCDAKEYGDLCRHYYDLYRDRKDAIYLGVGREFVFCSRPGSVPSPHCEMTFMLLHEIKISVVFKRLLLEDVLDIRKRVVARLCSWMTLPPDLKGGAVTADGPNVVERCP